MPFKNIRSLSEIIPSVQRKLTIVSLILFLIFTAMVTYKNVFSGLTLNG